MAEKQTTTTAMKKTAVNPSPTLEMGDIQAAIRIIDVVTQRGAFRGEELMGVATLRQRLVSTVESVNNTPPQPTTTEPTKTSEE